jgi:PAS domain S-box-containing protein
MRPFFQARTSLLLKAGALIVAMLLSLAIFVALRRLEDQNALAAFQGAANERFDALEITLGLTLDKIAAVGGFFDASHLVERQEFTRFTARIMGHDRTIHALAWIPRVPNHLRLAYEMAARAEGLSSFQISDRRSDGEMVGAAERSEYFPVFFVEPLQGNARALGFDLASDPARSAALRRSADDGRITATSRVVVINDTGNQYGFLVFRPFYRGGTDPSTREARRDKLAGFVLGVFLIQNVVESKPSNAATVSGLGLAVFDRDAPVGQRRLYPRSASFDGVGDLPKGPVATRTLAVAGSTWEVAAYPLPHAFAAVHWSSWSILGAELIVTAFAITYLFLMLDRKQAIERTVTERTVALNAAKKEAEKAERHYRKLLEVSPDAILLGRNDVITMANEAARKLFRVSSAEELVGRKFIDFVMPQFHTAVEEGLRTFSNEQELPLQEMQLLCGGAVVEVEASAASYLDDEGVNVQSVIRDISKRKRHEEASRRSEARLRGIADFAKDAIIMMDPRGLITFWNPAAESILGYRADEAIGKNLHQLLTPERYMEAHLAAFPGFLRTGRGNAIGKTVELAARGKDGREVTIDLSLSAMQLDGEWHAVGVLRDITERKRAEQARLFQHSLIRAILDVSPDGILVVNNDHIIESHNKMFLDVWRIPVVADIPSAQAVGMPEQTTLSRALELIKDPESFLERVRELYKDPDAIDHCETELKDGRTIERYSTNLWSESRQHLGRAWFFRDITERKQAELALRESEEKFRQLAENIREVFFVLTPSGDQTLYVSPAYEQIWDRSCDSIYRNPDIWLEAVHPDDRELTTMWVAKRLRGDPVEAEYRIRTPQGLEKWIRSRSFPVRDQAGKLIRIVGIAEEVTERKRYEEELIKARELAEAANRAKSIFLATMSHELRTPLNAVLGFTELLEIEMADRGIHDWDPDLRKIRSAGTHLLTLISDVMDLSKIEAGKLELQSANFDIGDLVREVAASVEPLAAKNGIDLQVLCEPAGFYGDRVRIGQCLFNLAGNACKFTHDGRVRMEAVLDGDWYTVRIVDTGIGISPEDLTKLFGDFTQLDASHARKYEGTGLGLAISRKLSRLMGGDITAQSTVGQGSTFTLRLPTGIVPVDDAANTILEKDAVCP